MTSNNTMTDQLHNWKVSDPRILSLFSEIPRTHFVPLAYRAFAQADMAIPLGQEPSQVMASPRILARLLQALSLSKEDKVLEIGTGSGYTTALLAALAHEVYSVEIDPALAQQARENLKHQGVLNAFVDEGDGAASWSLYAPYDAIFISGNLPFLPPAFVRDLKVGGRIVAILGKAPAMQAQIITKTSEAEVSCEPLFETSAAPLVNAPADAAFSL